MEPRVAASRVRYYFACGSKSVSLDPLGRRESPTRVITWNVGNRRDGRAQWEYLKSQNADVMLLQECRQPTHYLTAHEADAQTPYILWEPVARFVHPKGVCVYTNGLPLQKIPVASSVGRVLVARVTRPDRAESFVVITVHGDTTGNEFDTAKEAFHHALGEVGPVLRCGSPIVIGGDFNLSVHWSPEDGPVRDRLVTEFGMTNCTDFLEDKQRLVRNEVSTYCGHPHQDDYIFVSGFRVTHFDVLLSAGSLSDHYPVVADLEAVAT